METIEPRGVIVALSLDRDPVGVMELAEKLAPHVWGFKIHPSTEIAFLGEGYDIVSFLKELDTKIFFDGKYHDIPSEVAGWVRRDRERGIDMVSVHASGGAAMMSLAADESGDMTVLAITVLTSINSHACKQFYGESDIAMKVGTFARFAFESGCDGVVASVHEAEFLTNKAGQHYPPIIVTPGIRPMNYGKSDDQERVATPRMAREAGASFIVVGRPIRNANDPIEAAKHFSEAFLAL